MSRKARDRFAYETPDHLYEAARAICVETGREYPYLAEFHLEADDTYRLFAVGTIHRTNSGHVGRSGWDVDWIERDGMYAYHMSSGGGSLRRAVSGVYWRHPAMLHCVREETARYCGRAFRKRNKTRRLKRLPINIGKHEDLMQWLEYTGISSAAYYCTICKEHLPDEDICPHVWWCEEDGILRGPGSTEVQEPCDSDDCYYCSGRSAL